MRVGINVPDELLKRIEPIRHVANVSQICRQAIKDWVDTYERAQYRAKSDGRETAAAKLLAESIGQTIDWEALALEDARVWVQIASLKDFRALFNNLKINEREGRSDNWIPFYRPLEGTKMFWDRKHEHREWIYQQFELDDKTNHIQAAETKYVRAWLSYVTAVWQMVKDGIEADAKDRRAALTKAHAEVDLPPHLVGPERTVYLP